MFCSDEQRKVIIQPKSQSNISPGATISFTIQATGTDPLSYCWEWKAGGEGGGSGEWQPCPAVWSDGATLTIPSVQKSNEGIYRCVASNNADKLISDPAQLSIGKSVRYVLQLSYTMRWSLWIYTTEGCSLRLRIPYGCLLSVHFYT